ncbi:hypothetical protein BDB00DRAFT_805002 [Zychaea mexicana]|uniref:uncharacterized protein n=1 Tax=Zychaea mexicana TaxID=64656 RepID=UPI0022FE9F24|nr:uncharacterized protein BDB00DRAFT_805002 [Zychaea mexicana]KAI9497540.1 hypothetical protein BDB00DRAFT_805002 [Zychaea mexicana]
MTDSEEFNNVTWDMQDNNKNNAKSLHQSTATLDHDPAILDPLSDMDKTLSQALSNEPEELKKSTLFVREEEEEEKEEEEEAAHVNVDISDDPLDLGLSDVNKPTTNNYTTNNSTYYFNPDRATAASSSSSSSATPTTATITATEGETSATNNDLNWKSILVVDPRKENEGAYITYCIASAKSSFRRRFQDFVWLYNVLYTHYPACFVPPLPDKHRMEYVKGDRFGSDFVERRRISLQRFLQRIARHPILRRSEFFVKFLESSDFNDASARALREGQETVIDTIGDSLLNAFVKIRKRDEHFVQMRERTDRLEENLNLLEKTLARTNKRTDELSHDYDEFAQSVRGLVKHEADIELPLSKFAALLDEYSNEMKKMNTHDGLWLGEIHDYMSYYSVMKGVLKLRDQKQLDFEELSDYLQQTIAERERTLHPRSGDGAYNIAGYFTGKINEVRGADADKIKREKVLRLDDRIRELQDAIEQTHEVSTAFSEQVRREDEFLARSKAEEMRVALGNYTESKVEFFQRGADIWRDIATTLEQME